MGHVVALELPANNLSGCLPGGSLERLPKLLVLDLSKNQLQGEIPTELQHNNLCGALPNTLCELIQLSKVIVRGNNLTGCIPTDIGHIQSYFYHCATTSLQVSYHHLSVAVKHWSSLIWPVISLVDPCHWASLKNLEYLYLIDNALESRVPGSIARLKFLKESDFRDNRLCGELSNFLDG
ncbi:hypothetical protein PsorP6_017025 [Peronosclerospora sorghi]|uniref:Uncharacterized protein n=1 Tax=Peronosclerospora sorghi TaxID=230839 RepID=A0ACC0WEM4_9STRA|nr:hypothetical protein PsorP6_017025 [Peronosclerospora sorghi]